MDSNYKAYSHVSSFARINGILATPQGNYEEVTELPDRDRLTFANGFYAMCTAVFVDIRDSSSLPSKYNRPALAKLYRAYLSEVVAILNSSSRAREINIVGDGVWAAFNTPLKNDIDEVFSLIAKVNSLMKVLNYKLRKAGYMDPIAAGIGVSYGRVLMVKAGYSGSGISDVVYMGDVVNHAAKLAAKGSLGNISPSTYLDNVFAENLNEHNSGLIKKDWNSDCYTADVINPAMNQWFDENCK